VVKGSEKTELKYKLTNIRLAYEIIRSKTLADEARSVYSSGNEFAYDHVQRLKMVSFKKETDTRLNIKVDAQRRSLKAIPLLFRKMHLPGSDESQRHDQRLAQHDFQRRHRRQ